MKTGRFDGIKPRDQTLSTDQQRILAFLQMRRREDEINRIVKTADDRKVTAFPLRKRLARG